MCIPSNDYIESDIPIELMCELDKLEKDEIFEVMKYLKRRLKEKFGVNVYIFTDEVDEDE